ncbi:MAG: c-type cytochrome [Planctomycetota bacterium]|nr:c-type cytochrome [Planctomycetota bacterium]
MNIRRSHKLKWQAMFAMGLLFLAAGLSYSADGPAEVWKAPARAARAKNPVASDADSIAAGKKIFTTNCLACHGAAGKGDGPASIACNPRPKDLSDPKIASQTDGELFWKITTGRKPMPTYEKLLSENDRWSVIDYSRTLEPTAAETTQPTTQPASGQ